MLLVKEAVCAAWGWTWLEVLAQDLRYGARMLRRNPGFAAVAIVTLALGIGVNTAMFSIFDAVGLQPLPVKDGGRLMAIFQTFHGRYSRYMYGNSYLLSCPEFLHYSTPNQVFTETAATALLGSVIMAGSPP